LIQDGSRVKLHYTLTVDGETIDSSEGKEPLEYEHNRGQIIPGLEAQLAGLNPGDRKEVVVEPAQGYGERDPEAVQEVPKAAFADGVEDLEPGVVVSGQSGDNVFRATVVAVKEETVELDFNHPLAGKTLHFNVEVVSVD